MRVVNPEDTSKDVILGQLNESRPLPMGMSEFDEWSERIMSGAICSADKASQQFALANMLLHLGPTESHKPDAFFIHSLRKFAVNEVAAAVRDKLYAEKKAKEEAEKAKAAENAEGAVGLSAS